MRFKTTRRALNKITPIFLSCLIAIGFLVTGCSHECETYAEAACENAGEDSETCRQIRERASHASAADLRACELALGLVEKFKKVR
jgi:hypothetical protein